MLRHPLLDGLQLLGVDEHLEIAGVSEVDLGREKGRASDAPVAGRGHVRERRRQQRAADAIADPGKLTFACRLLDAVNGGEDALAHVAVEVLVGMAFVGIDPGDDEHGQALRDRPADERLLGIEVENVELVDPRGDNEQRPFMHLGRARLVLDELHQRVAKNHLARRRRHVDAKLERARVRLANPQVAMSRMDVLGQHLQAPHQVLAALGERRAQKLRVGGEEVRGRERGGDLPQVELRLLAIVRIELVGVLDQIVGPARR